jgi:hypothetical protein
MAADGSVVGGVGRERARRAGAAVRPQRGDAHGGDPLATTTLNETSPRLAMQPGGNFVAVWNVLSPGDNDDA